MKSIFKWVKWIVLVLVVLLLVGAGVAYWLITKSQPQISGTLQVAALKSPVEVVRDPMGMPHIYASNLDDLFFAQGYVQAQDRLWQMELFRHIGEGRTAELFGSVSLDNDKYLRTIGLGRAAQADWDNANNEEKQALTAFSAGVNAFLQSHQNNLPIEFTLLGISPAPWQPLDSMAWVKVLAFNLGSNGDAELLRAALLQKFSPDQLKVLWPSSPSDGPVIIPSEVKDYRASTSRSPADVTPLLPIGRPDVSALTAQDSILGMHASIGSNNWVVDGTKSTTGKPLLANDPHLGIQMPSIWYEVGLHCQPVTAECPYNVVGVGFSATPGVVIGHNDRIAWGLTDAATIGPTVQDYFVEKDNPDQPNQYQYQGQWKDYQLAHEVIHVKGAADQSLDVKISQHGPVMTPVLQGVTETLALEWTATHDADHVVGALLGIDRVGSFDEFRNALRMFNAPSLNFIYADVDGNIGYQMPGRIPVRAHGDGTVPVPGWTGEYDWTGYIPYDDLPFVYNPSTHYIVTANNRVVPDGYKYVLTTDWAAPWRAQRITDLLRAKDKLSPEDFQAIQADVTSLPLQQLQPYLVSLTFDQPLVTSAWAYLKTWDGRLAIDSVGAAQLEVTFQHMAKDTFGNKMDADLFEAYYGAGYHAAEIHRMALINLLSQPNSEWWDDPATPQKETRDDILKKSYTEAVNDLAQQLGNTPADWGWGRLHTVIFAHPVGSVKPLNLLFNVGPLAVPGDTFTVDNTAFNDANGYAAFVSSSARFIMNVADWDQTLAIHTTGQSGQPLSAHYSDMINLWRDVRYLPFYFTRSALLQTKVNTLTLTP